MIIFGTLVAFVTIFISENVETRLSFYSTYEIGVKGTFICNQEKIGFAYILVGEKEVDLNVDRPIAGTAGKYLKPFYLIGSVKSFYKPVLYITVVHNCSNIYPQYIKYRTKKFPKEYIVHTGRRLKLFDLGVVNLAIPPSNRTNRSRRRNSAIPLPSVLV